MSVHYASPCPTCGQQQALRQETWPTATTSTSGYVHVIGPTEIERMRMRIDELEKHFAAVSQVVDFLETQAPARNPVSG